ncbi:MAG: hypothetical protein ABMB14_36540, partial [Myxococcota bacterium]
MIAFLPVVLTVRPPLWREAPRPALSGPVEDLDAGRFRVHFTRTGADAPPADDVDGDGLPDQVGAIADALVDAEAAYLDEGWRPLAGDDGADGSDAIDVYVRDVDIYGYSTPVRRQDGTWSCFVEIDRGATVVGSVARSVATHELHHCVEFRYTATTAAWLFEAAATYEQYSHVVDPVLDFAVGVLYGERLGAPDRKLAATDGRFEYAGFLWMKYWSERGGFEPDRLPALWEHLEGADDWQAGLDAAAEDAFGAGLAETYADWAGWNTFACSGSDGAHYLDQPIACIADVTVPYAAWDGGERAIVHDEHPFTAEYLALDAAERTEVTCHGDEGLRIEVLAVDRTGAEVGAGAGGDGDPIALAVPD